ncbi:1639_t:CDS:1, partial [Dentiscutata heterogama]
REHVNEVEVTVGKEFNFGILVAAEAHRIQPGAIRATIKSGGKVITTTYNRICDDIKEK